MSVAVAASPTTSTAASALGKGDAGIQ
jgi:hypothetical protein